MTMRIQEFKSLRHFFGTLVALLKCPRAWKRWVGRPDGSVEREFHLHRPADPAATWSLPLTKPPVFSSGKRFCLVRKLLSETQQLHLGAGASSQVTSFEKVT